jgi:hypothetical protein
MPTGNRPMHPHATQHAGEARFFATGTEPRRKFERTLLWRIGSVPMRESLGLSQCAVTRSAT